MAGGAVTIEPTLCWPATGNAQAGAMSARDSATRRHKATDAGGFVSS